MKKSYIYLVACTFLFTFGLSFVTGSSVAYASGLSGWAWSSTIGWVSFSSSNPELSGVTPPGSAYGVNISFQNSNPVTPPTNLIGTLSGYAWSPNIGWISFDPADVTSTNCPLLSSCTPTINLTTGAVSGWARALAGSGTMGWDGWIELAGAYHVTNSAVAENRGVTFSSTTRAFSGYAWGSTNVGWLSFANVTCPGCFLPLTVVNPTIASGVITITSSPAGISCNSGSSCTGSFLVNTKVTLTATPSLDYTLQSWSSSGGDTCSAVTGTDSCNIILLNSDTVTPSFVPNLQLNVTKLGTGIGTVTSSDSHISCGVTCSFNYPSGTKIVLTATPNTGSYFTGWSGACSGSNTTCTISGGHAQTATASFTLNPRVTVITTGTGGKVIGNIGNISCTSVGGNRCVASLSPGTVVNLTAATTSQNVSFKGWGGACTGTASTCQITMPIQTPNVGDMATTYSQWKSLVFSASVLSASSTIGDEMADPDNDGIPNIYEYAVGTDPFTENLAANKMAVYRSYKSETGSYFVFDHKANSNRTDVTFVIAVTTTIGRSILWSYFPATPSLFNETQQVIDSFTKLVADTYTTAYTAPGSGYFIFGINKAGVNYWAPASINPAPSTTAKPGLPAQELIVTAEFISNPTLTVAGSGTGSGTITSSIGNISCAHDGTTDTGTCSTQYSPGTSVTLTATNVTGSSFTGWSGVACIGLTCDVTVDASKTVTAAFTLAPVTLTVTATGSGGTVTGSGGISCTSAGGLGCSAQYTLGTTVNLTVATTTGYTFTSWSGACTGTLPTCAVTMNAAKSVSATFGVAASNLSGTCEISPATYSSYPVTVSFTGLISQNLILTKGSGSSDASWISTSITFNSFGTFSPTVVLKRSSTDQVKIQCNQVTLTYGGPTIPPSSLTGTCKFPGSPYILPSGSQSMVVNPTMTFSGGTAPYSVAPLNLSYVAGVYQPTVLISDSTSPNPNRKLIQCDSFVLNSGISSPAGTYKLFVGDTAAEASALNRTSVNENSATPFYLYWLNSDVGCTWAITRDRPGYSNYESTWINNGLPSAIVQNSIGLKKIETIGIPVDAWHLQMMCGGSPKGNMVNMNVGDTTVVES